MHQILKKITFFFRVKSKKAKIANYVIGGVLLIYLSLLIYPNFFFKYSIKFKNIRLYSINAFDNNTAKLLSEVSQRLSVSTINDTTVTHNVYLCNNFSLYTFFAPASRNAFGCNYLPFNSIFFASCDVKKNEAYKNDEGDNYIRQLDQVITHEITHRLIKEKVGLWKAGSMDMWKNEGYCETVGYNESYDIVDAKKFLKVYKNTTGNRVFYRKCYYAVSYLIQIKKMQFEDIVKSDLTLDQVLSEIEKTSIR